MAKKTPHELLKEALLLEAERPPRELFQELIDRGAIDAEGRVLIRGPEPIRGKAKAKKKG